jgi:hypothetical protein
MTLMVAHGGQSNVHHLANFLVIVTFRKICSELHRDCAEIVYRLYMS